MRTKWFASVFGLAVVAAGLQVGGPAAAGERPAASHGAQPAVTPAAYSATVIGDWPMNESGGRTMTDVSGHGLNGYIGTSVVTNWPTGDGGVGYHFSGPLNVQNRERLVLVNDNPMLDPGTGTYSVIVRFRTTLSQPNILQKGQSQDAGGYWKLVIHDGGPRCHYRDLNYNTKATDFGDKPPPNAKVNDGKWHVVRCERNANSVCLYLDEGTPTAMHKCISGSIGNIDNKWPLSIGGKQRCDPKRATTTCDYFSGDIDWVRIERPSVPFGSG
jgi:hypothetical protein